MDYIYAELNDAIKDVYYTGYLPENPSEDTVGVIVDINNQTHRISADLSEATKELLATHETEIAHVEERLNAEIDRAEAADAAIIERLNVAEDDINTLEDRATAVEGRLDVIEGESEGSIKKALQDAKAYVDDLFDTQGARDDDQDSLIAANKAAIEKEVSDRESAISGVVADYTAADLAINDRIGSVTEGKTVVDMISDAQAAAEGYADNKASAAQVAAEQTAANALSAAVQTLNTKDAALVAEDARLAGLISANATAIDKEIEDRTAAVKEVSDKVDVEKVSTAIALAKSEAIAAAKSETDGQVSALTEKVTKNTSDITALGNTVSSEISRVEGLVTDQAAALNAEIATRAAEDVRLDQAIKAFNKTSGIYVVSKELAKEGASSLPISNILIYDKTLQVGDILTDTKGTIAQAKGVSQRTGESINPGDTFNTIYFDTSVTPNFDAFDWSGAEVYTGEESNSLNGMEFIKLFTFTQWGTESSFDAFRGTYEGSPFYALVHAKDGVMYASVQGWVETEHTYDEPMAVHEVYQQDIWTKYIFKTPSGEFVDYEVISNNQIPQEVYDSIEEARQIAEGRARSKAYDTLQDLVQQLNSTPITEFKVADNIYVYQTDVPDYWVGQVNSTLVEYTYVDDTTTIEYIKSKGQIGYYVLGILETEKVEYSANYNDLENKPSINGVELVGAKTSSDLKLGQVTANGGFWAGRGATAEGGGSVGLYAKTGRGGSVGEGAQSDYGGAIGWRAYTSWGGSIGREADSKYGFAGGHEAKARYAADGTTEINYAIAIGFAAKAQAENAAQIGKGTNANEGTLQFRDYQVVDANGKIPVERVSDSILISLAAGQPIEKIVFNPNVSIEKMTDYLSGLTYDEAIKYDETAPEVQCVCKLVSIDWFNNSIAVYAIDFNAFSSMMGTSGYAIGVVDTSGDGFVVKQTVFATEYSEANLQLVTAMADKNYTVQYTHPGWNDTKDYVLDTSTNHRVVGVHDNKVSAFVGRDTRLWDILSMFIGTEWGAF